MKTFVIITLGCRVNRFETDAVSASLQAAGWQPGEKDVPADLCVINTCSVTGKGSMQSRQAVRRAIRNHPNACIVVTGCYAQIASGDIEAIKGVHYIIGQGEKHRIHHIVPSPGAGLPEKPVMVTGNIAAQKTFSTFPHLPRTDRTRPVLKIQDGCDAFCTYCIVPHARGRSRSMVPEEILETLSRFGAQGFREVVLSGIHLGLYGRDFSPGMNLVDLLRQIETDRPVDRIRLSSIEPGEIGNDLIHLMSSSDFFCRHLHIPLQSGSDCILQRMHRPYTSAEFAAVVASVRNAMPDAAIGADVLIGFPGETETDFENTRELVSSLPLTYLHVFPFSPRPGTPAATFKDPIPEPVIRKRCNIMRQLGRKKKREFAMQWVGNRIDGVLVEESRHTDTGLLKGISSNYLSVLMEGGDPLKNTFVSVDVKQATDHLELIGTVTDYGAE